MRRVFYALGGGLGHVTRALHIAQREGSATDTWDILVSPQIRHWDVAVPSSVRLRVLPLEAATNGDAARQWALDFLTPTTASFWLDAFPMGLFGEWKTLPDLPAHHTARLLQPGGWMRARGERRFEETLVLEPLHTAHHAYLNHHSKTLREVSIPAPSASPDTPHGTGYWLVVHSGPVSEVETLLSHCPPQARIVVATDPGIPLPTTVERATGSPGSWYSGAERIVTAAGFNTIRETTAYRSKQWIVPFPRRFDDQFQRAATLRRAPVPRNP